VSITPPQAPFTILWEAGLSATNVAGNGTMTFVIDLQESA
jgi:hypothetical protein